MKEIISYSWILYSMAWAMVLPCYVTATVVDGWLINPSNALDPVIFIYGYKVLHPFSLVGPVFSGGLYPGNYAVSVVNTCEINGYTSLECYATSGEFSSTYYLKLKKLPDNAMEIIAEGDANVIEFRCGNILGETENFNQFYVGQRAMEAFPLNDGLPPVIYWPSTGLYIYAHWDEDYSNASTFKHRLKPKQNFQVANPPISCDTGYGILTDGSRCNLKERYIVRIASDMWETFNPLSNAPSEFRYELAEMLFFDHWGGPGDGFEFEKGRFVLSWLRKVTGERLKFFSIIEAWDNGGFDVCNPDAYRIPDHNQPASKYGTKEQLIKYIELGKATGRIGLRCNYFNAKDASWSIQEGLVQRAIDKDLNIANYTDFNSVKALAARQENDIRTDFEPTAAFQDQWGSIGPGPAAVNFDANASGAGTISYPRRIVREICELSKQLHNAPLATESLFSEWLFGQYCDTGDFGIQAADTRFDFTPEYKLRRLHNLASVHSMGLGYRYFYGSWEPNWVAAGREKYFNNDEALDGYRACEVLYGNGAYLYFKANSDLSLRKVHALTECYTVGVAQRYYLLQPIDYVLYGKDGQWKTIQQIIPGCNTLADLQSWYKKFHIRYSNGCHVWVNRDAISNVTVALPDSAQITLPQNGWLVYTEDSNLVAYTGLNNGYRVDFCEDKNRGIKYVNPRKAPSYHDVNVPTVWLDGNVYLSLHDPNKSLYEMFVNERCGGPNTVYLSADVTMDCYVDFRDISRLGLFWKACTDPTNHECDQYWDNTNFLWITILSDTFNISTPPDNNQNIELDTRQTGIDAPNPWEDYGTGNTLPGGAYDNRVIINASNQLEIFVPSTSGSISAIIPGQIGLPQDSSYRLSWDQGASLDWSFVKFNTTTALSVRDCGFLVYGSKFPGRIEFHADNLRKWDSLNTHPSGFTPTGENGLHHFDVTVLNGQMTAVIDNVYTYTYDLTTIVNGTGATGIGSLSFNARGTNQYGYLDNVVYETLTSKPVKCGDIGTIYLAGDITGPDGVLDCYVDLYDLALLSEQWLRCNDPVATQYNCI